jgi:cation diffusion facilitator CzcD-associated flavoprotein CzcO
MNKAASVQGLVIVGAGPGGMAPLLAATNKGKLQELLQAGVTVIESGSAVGRGSLGGHDLESDSSAEALLDVVMRSQEGPFVALRTHPATLRLQAFANGPAPLHIVAHFLEVVSQTVCAMVSASERGRVLLNTGALSVRSTGHGTWLTTCFKEGSTIEVVESLNVVLATGAHQPLTRLAEEKVAGEPLLPRYAGKVMQTGTLFTAAGLREASEHLSKSSDPKIAIVGGSTSAAAAAGVVLQRMPSLHLQAGAVTLLHRKPLRLFYESVNEALADGYTDFRPSDVCRLTGRVYRLGGLRLKSRKLIMGVLGVGPRPADDRLRLLRLEPRKFAEARAVLDGADLIVAAFGYRPRLLPVYDESMREIVLLSPSGSHWAVVDADSRVLDADQRPLHGLFAVGLAIGPAASDRLGGEAGFCGQVNSLWLWQHTIGEEICEHVLQRVQTRAEYSSLTAASILSSTGRNRPGAAVTQEAA